MKNLLIVAALAAFALLPTLAPSVSADAQGPNLFHSFANQPWTPPPTSQDLGSVCHQLQNRFNVFGLCGGNCDVAVTTLPGASYPDCGGCGFWYRATWTCPGGTYVIDYNGILECGGEDAVTLTCPEGGADTIQIIAQCGDC